MANNLFATGKVEYVEWDSLFGVGADALRIKVRLDSDSESIGTMDLPWAFPANPKLLHIVPKVGEGVFVFNSEIGNPNSQRLYIGPIISQPQYQEYCQYDIDNSGSEKASSRGPAMSLLSTQKAGTVKPLTAITRKRDMVYGSFPESEDVAIMGRGQEDIILKYRNNTGMGSESEIDLRAGIRLEPTDNTIEYLKGNVVFNSTNPGYIQVKYAKNGLSGLKSGTGDNDGEKYESKSQRTANSVVNIVADKINIISHKDNNQFGEKIRDRENLIKNGELDEIMSNLHRCVYGDELIVILKKIVNVLATHTHPCNMLQPTWGGTELPDLIEYEYEKIISPNVRIS